MHDLLFLRQASGTAADATPLVDGRGHARGGSPVNEITVDKGHSHRALADG
jgi:hypothetical protein